MHLRGSASLKWEAWNSISVVGHCPCHLVRGELDYLVGLRTLLLILLINIETFMEHEVHKQDGKPKMMRYTRGMGEQLVKHRNGQSKISKHLGDGQSGR